MVCVDNPGSTAPRTCDKPSRGAMPASAGEGDVIVVSGIGIGRLADVPLAYADASGAPIVPQAVAPPYGPWRTASRPARRAAGRRLAARPRRIVSRSLP
jgi:hypothetical protein